MSLTNFKLNSLKDKINEEALVEAKKLAETSKVETTKEKEKVANKKKNKTNE